ncbi:hypothetical protein QYE76_019874 [Lolium multiflorum]|uniref:Uncharacterized protein n=1 Tax=Lolium multiflorum TaxID=4521 RepID=A0AAD8VNK0_LOLMU|nr:hypothetical protein QYE76_019874 [Lolium multiflorum]
MVVVSALSLGGVVVLIVDVLVLARVLILVLVMAILFLRRDLAVEVVEMGLVLLTDQVPVNCSRGNPAKTYFKVKSLDLTSVYWRNSRCVA